MESSKAKCLNYHRGNEGTEFGAEGRIETATPPVFFVRAVDKGLRRRIGVKAVDKRLATRIGVPLDFARGKKAVDKGVTREFGSRDRGTRCATGTPPPVFWEKT